jgi:hypothetical protein
MQSDFFRLEFCDESAISSYPMKPALRQIFAYLLLFSLLVHGGVSAFIADDNNGFNAHLDNLQAFHDDAQYQLGQFMLNVDQGSQLTVQGKSFQPWASLEGIFLYQEFHFQSILNSTVHYPGSFTLQFGIKEMKFPSHFFW